jgi:hypothetical protein
MYPILCAPFAVVSFGNLRELSARDEYVFNES